MANQELSDEVIKEMALKALIQKQHQDILKLQKRVEAERIIGSVLFYLREMKAVNISFDNLIKSFELYLQSRYGGATPNLDNSDIKNQLSCILDEWVRDEDWSKAQNFDLLSLIENVAKEYPPTP